MRLMWLQNHGSLNDLWDRKGKNLKWQDCAPGFSSFSYLSEISESLTDETKSRYQVCQTK